MLRGAATVTVLFAVASGVSISAGFAADPSYASKPLRRERNEIQEAFTARCLAHWQGVVMQWFEDVKPLRLRAEFRLEEPVCNGSLCHYRVDTPSPRPVPTEFSEFFGLSIDVEECRLGRSLTYPEGCELYRRNGPPHCSAIESIRLVRFPETVDLTDNELSACSGKHQLLVHVDGTSEHPNERVQLCGILDWDDRGTDAWLRRLPKSISWKPRADRTYPSVAMLQVSLQKRDSSIVVVFENVCGCETVDRWILERGSRKARRESLPAVEPRTKVPK
jgi:hypothetical protein